MDCKVSECPIERPKRNSEGRRRNRQKHYYSGKKKRHSIKAQVSVEKGKILATYFANGKKHDFRMYKESKLPLPASTIAEVDLGYQGIKKYHKADFGRSLQSSVFSPQQKLGQIG